MNGQIGIGTQRHGNTMAQRKQKAFSAPCARVIQKNKNSREQNILRVSVTPCFKTKEYGTFQII